MTKVEGIAAVKEISLDVVSTIGVVLPFTDWFDILKGGVGLVTMVVILLINVKRYKNLYGKGKDKKETKV